jgi:hypothetical protein
LQSQIAAAATSNEIAITRNALLKAMMKALRLTSDLMAAYEHKILFYHCKTRLRRRGVKGNHFSNAEVVKDHSSRCFAGAG